MLPDAKAEKSLRTELVWKGCISELARSPAVKFLQHPGERPVEKKALGQDRHVPKDTPSLERIGGKGGNQPFNNPEGRNL